MFAGAIVNAAKGVFDKVNNKNTIVKLSKELEEKLWEGLTDVEKDEMLLKMKQVELELAYMQEQSRQKCSQLEKEIIQLMEESLVQQEKILNEKQATQMDIANVLIEFQTQTNKLKDEMSGLEEKMQQSYKQIDAKISRINKLQSEQNRKMNEYEQNYVLFKKDVEYKYASAIKQGKKSFYIYIISLVCIAILIGILYYQIFP